MREFDPMPKIQKSGPTATDAFKTVDEPAEVLGGREQDAFTTRSGKRVEVGRKGRRGSRD